MKNPFKVTSPNVFNISLTVLIVAALQINYVWTYYLSGPAPSRDFDFGPGILLMFGVIQAIVALVGIGISLSRKDHK